MDLYLAFSNLSNELFDLPSMCFFVFRSVYTIYWSPWSRWFGTFYIFHILGIIIPIDFHIFQRIWNHQPALDPTDSTDSTDVHSSPVSRATGPRLGGWDGARGGRDGGAECGETRGENRSRAPGPNVWTNVEKNGSDSMDNLYIYIYVYMYIYIYTIMWV